MKLLKGKAKVSIIAIFFLLLLAIACFADEDTRGGGLFSAGSFLSDAISSATGKLDKVASGGEKIVDDDAKGISQDTLEYDGDPLGRPMVKPNFRNKEKGID